MFLNIYYILFCWVSSSGAESFQQMNAKIILTLALPNNFDLSQYIFCSISYVLNCSLNLFLFQLMTMLLVKLLLIVELSLPPSHNSHHCGSYASYTRLDYRALSSKPQLLNDLTCLATLPPTPPGPPPI